MPTATIGTMLERARSTAARQSGTRTLLRQRTCPKTTAPGYFVIPSVQEEQPVQIPLARVGTRAFLLGLLEQA